MSNFHLAYLNLGSNIQPETNLVKAIQLLQNHGKIEKLSNAWESKSVGSAGPNYLNACAAFRTAFLQRALKEQVLLPIETELGRRRTEDKFAPRTMDIDIVLFDDVSCDDKYWNQAFVVVPLAEIYPTFRNPILPESLHETATRLRRNTWMEARLGVWSQFRGNNFAA